MWKEPRPGHTLIPVPTWTLPSDTLLCNALVIFAELLVCKTRVKIGYKDERRHIQIP